MYAAVLALAVPETDQVGPWSYLKITGPTSGPTTDLILDIIIY
jgi:hypothetical protein